MNKEEMKIWVDVRIKNNPFSFKKGIIHECRKMDKADVYEWVAEDELKIIQLNEKVNQLERKNEILEATQYCPYDKDCGKLYDCTKEEYQKMCEANVDLMAKIDQLETNWNELKEYIRKTKIKEFEKAYGKRYGRTFTQAEIIVCNMLIEKMQELEGGSNE